MFCVANSKFQLVFEPAGFLFSTLHSRVALLCHLVSREEKNQILLNDYSVKKSMQIGK